MEKWHRKPDKNSSLKRKQKPWLECHLRIPSLCPRFESGRHANHMAIYDTAHMATANLTWLCHSMNGYVKHSTKINFYSTQSIIWKTLNIWIWAIGDGQLVMNFPDSWRINQGPNIYLDPWRVPSFSLCDWQKTCKFLGGGDLLCRTDQTTQHSTELLNRLSKVNTSCGLAQQIFSS